MSALESVPCTRGTTNRNDRGNSTDRRRRREYLVETYRADITGIRISYADEPIPFLPTALVGTSQTVWPSVKNFTDVWDLQVRIRRNHGYIVSIEAVPACRCYRCGDLLTVDTVTVDRIIPGCLGGTYRRNNIRPACGACNSETGGALAHIPKRGKR